MKDNIADFGGDPAKVVAFGSSSGAMCAHAHLLSPMSNGTVLLHLKIHGILTNKLSNWNLRSDVWRDFVQWNNANAGWSII